MRPRPLCLGLVALVLASLLPAPAPAEPPRVGARLRYLLARQDAGLARPGAAQELAVTVRLRAGASATQLERLERAGLELRAVPGATPDRPGLARVGDRAVLASGGLVPGRASRAAIERLLADPAVRRIEASWAPARRAPLHQTPGLVGADQLWAAPSFLTGEGVLIADIDSGVDHFHPDLWAADGDTLDFLDEDGSGGWSAGDGVDRDGNGSQGPGERLAWLNAPGNAPGMSTALQPAIDHFFADLDLDGVRDFGVAAGFSEADPTYGEPVFRLVDDNGNGALDAGERLVALGSPKLLAVYETDAQVRRAGVDLIESEGDNSSHGTEVASILVGNDPSRRFRGVAPDARLVSGNILYGDDFVNTPMEERMLWAAAEGADIMVLEIGGWVWEFLDGSSPVELLTNQLAEQGVAMVVPAGNLATGGMHAEQDIGRFDGNGYTFVLDSVSPQNSSITEIYGDFYWRPAPGDSFRVQLESPAGDVFDLTGPGGSFVTGGAYRVWHAHDLSPRGTRRLDYQVERLLPVGNLDGSWQFAVTRVGTVDQARRVHAMVSDNTSGWLGNSTWTPYTGDNTITWPATADSAITVAAYQPQTGNHNSFSGRGVRIDGHWLQDVAAPGSITYTAVPLGDRGGVPGGYGAFGGTSAAGPHVAGVLAQLKQWDPSLGPGEMRRLLRQGAVVDATTGTVPNPRWGYGRLWGPGSLQFGQQVAAPPVRPAGPRLHPNHPNPFNPRTTLAFELPRAGQLRLRLLDLRGRLVRTLLDEPWPAGTHRVVWDGSDDRGRAVASGIYLVQLALDGSEHSRKIALLR